MMKARHLIFLALFSTLMAGCYSNLPVGEPEEAVFDPRLPGRWSYPDPQSGENTVVVVARFSETDYVVSPEAQFREADALRMFVTRLNGQHFLNFQELRRSFAGRAYMFALYEVISSDEVRLDVPTLDALPHEVRSSDELRRVFMERGDIPGFYEPKPTILHRLKD